MDTRRYTGSQGPVRVHTENAEITEAFKTTDALSADSAFSA